MPLELNKSNARKLLDHFESESASVFAFARELCEIESPSGDAVGSRTVAARLEEAAKRIPFVWSIERLPAATDYGEHFRLRAFGEGAASEPTLLLLGHTDTVHPKGTLVERPWRVDEGRIYAPGVFDMKASCAVTFAVLRALAMLDITPRRPLVLLLTCDEESGSHSGRAFVEEEARRAGCVLVLEPPASGGRVKTARKGTGLFTLRVEGRAAHAGLEPEKGTSAILEIARQIERISTLARPELGTTINIGTISGGTHANVVAAEALAEIDVRFSTQDEARRVDDALRLLSPFDERARVHVSGGINRPPMERTVAVAELFEKARHIASVFDFELGETSVGGASDGNFAAACGATVLDGLGVEGDGAHAAHEHIKTDGFALRCALLAALVATL